MTKAADSGRAADGAKSAPAATLSVVSLEDAAARDPELVGGKAASLARLMAKGLPVPPGFCVTTAAFEELARLQSASLPAQLEQSIRGAYERLSGGDRDCPVAVRSSAVCEDRPDASFAGQYETVLGVRGWTALWEAIQGCWASLYGERALAYRHGRATEPTSAVEPNRAVESSRAAKSDRAIEPDRQMAVLVQRLIEADVAGVAFSCDPTTGEQVVVADASWGLGEAVVSGWVAPDHYRLTRSGTLIDAKIGAKRVRATVEAGSKRQAVPEDLQLAPCLVGDQLAELARLAVRAEEVANSPQDLEFALADDKLWLLQSRPITTAAPEPLLEPEMCPWPEEYWTRAIADEYWADSVTPLSFSSLGSWIDRDTTKAMDRIMGLGEIEAMRPTLRLYRSHVYWNANAVAAGFKYVPQAARTEHLLAYLPPGMRERAAELPTAWRRRLRAELLMRVRDRTSAVRRNHRALDAHTKRVRTACSQLDRIDLNRADVAEIERYWQTVDGLGRAHFAIIRWGMQQHSLTFNFILAKLLSAWLDDDGRLFSALIGSSQQNLTLQSNRQVWRLARLAEREAAVHRLLEDASMPPLEVGDNHPSPNYEALLEQAGEGPFANELRCFLEEHGHRGFTRDIGLPRWGEQPDALLALVAQALGDSQDPDERARLERHRREAAEQATRAQLGSSVRGYMHRALFDLLLRYARTYTAFRENQRFTLDRILLRARRAALAYGRLLAKRTLAENRGDVFFLTLDEVRRALGGELAEPSHLIDTRRRSYATDSHSLPPMYLRGNEPIDEQSSAAAKSGALTGMPVSAGRVVSRCHVARKLDDAGGLKRGDILVASNIDPGWTPLLINLGGLVLETGGVLAHGAIVAREYGIPAVTAVEAATQRIRDGEWLTVDGSAGTVERHGARPPAGEEPTP